MLIEAYVRLSKDLHYKGILFIPFEVKKKLDWIKPLHSEFFQIQKMFNILYGRSSETERDGICLLHSRSQIKINELKKHFTFDSKIF